MGGKPIIVDDLHQIRAKGKSGRGPYYTLRKGGGAGYGPGGGNPVFLEEELIGNGSSRRTDRGPGGFHVFHGFRAEAVNLDAPGFGLGLHDGGVHIITQNFGCIGGYFDGSIAVIFVLGPQPVLVFHKLPQHDNHLIGGYFKVQDKKAYILPSLHLSHRREVAAYKKFDWFRPSFGIQGYGKPHDAVDITLEKIQFLPGKGSQKDRTLKPKLKGHTENHIFSDFEKTMRTIYPKLG
jgi:hypothetical protein